MAGKHSDHYFRRWQAKIVTTVNFFFEKNEKNEKCLELPDLKQEIEKVDQNIFLKILPPPPPGFFRFFLRLLCRHMIGPSYGDGRQK